MTGTDVSVGALVSVAAGMSVGASVGTFVDEVKGVSVAFTAMVGVASTFPIPHPDRIREKIKINLKVNIFFIVNGSSIYSVNKVNGIHIPSCIPTVHAPFVFKYKDDRFSGGRLCCSYIFSNSSTILLSTSKPPCQNFAERISMPASARIFAGASEPPADRILRYFGLNDSPSALNCW